MEALRQARSTMPMRPSRQLGLAGSAEQVTDTLTQYLASGFDYTVALFPYTRERDMLQRYAEDVRPHLA